MEALGEGQQPLLQAATALCSKQRAQATHVLPLAPTVLV